MWFIRLKKRTNSTDFENKILHSLVATHLNWCTHLSVSWDFVCSKTSNLFCLYLHQKSFKNKFQGRFRILLKISLGFSTSIWHSTNLKNLHKFRGPFWKTHQLWNNVSRYLISCFLLCKMALPAPVCSSILVNELILVLDTDFSSVLPTHLPQMWLLVTFEENYVAVKKPCACSVSKWLFKMGHAIQACSLCTTMSILLIYIVLMC